MGTWIEICSIAYRSNGAVVVPCNGNVDWNIKKNHGAVPESRRSLQWERGLKFTISALTSYIQAVVPCNGNVDWNITRLCVKTLIRCRSLQWERGLKYTKKGGWYYGNWSFPAMGTWIEIGKDLRPFQKKCVVPCNGNVDWNISERSLLFSSSRRSLQWERGLKYKTNTLWCCINLSRSLQWERGLKCVRHRISWHALTSFPAMGTWIEIKCICQCWYCGTVVPCNGNVDWNAVA